jgi:hypothetical protein
MPNDKMLKLKLYTSKCRNQYSHYPNLTESNAKRLSPNTCWGRLTPAGGRQEGSEEFDILTFGNLDFDMVM